MQILLRRYGSEEYVWKKAVYKSEVYYITGDYGDEYRIRDVEIVAVKDNEYAEYMICANCGALIKNTNEEIEKHYAEMEAKRDCASCSDVNFADKKLQSRTIENEDGTYTVTETFTARPRCAVVSWNPCSIESAVKNGRCKFIACRSTGMRPQNSIFFRLPGVFDSAITVDVLNANKYKYDGANSDYFVYDLRSRGTIKACVNSAGVVDHFIVSSKGNKVIYYYSEKYDKMFYKNGWEYIEGKPYWFTDTKFNEAHQKIKALYKGAE